MELKRLTEAPYMVKVKLRGPDGAEEEIRVIYKPITATVLKEIDAIRLDPERTIVDQAILLVRGLPDVKDEGQPVQIDRKLFDAMDVRHLSSIVKAITSNFFSLEPTAEIPTEEGLVKDRREEESRARERAENEAQSAQSE